MLDMDQYRTQPSSDLTNWVLSNLKIYLYIFWTKQKVVSIHSGQHNFTVCSKCCAIFIEKLPRRSLWCYFGKPIRFIFGDPTTATFLRMCNAWFKCLTTLQLVHSCSGVMENYQFMSEQRSMDSFSKRHWNLYSADLSASAIPSTRDMVVAYV